MPKAYGGATCYEKTKINKIIKAKNKAPDGDGGVDEKTQETLQGHGICSGMTTTWVIGFLGTQAGANDVREFEAYFDNVLRFQGAYLKENGGRIEKQLEAVLKEKLDHDCKKLTASKGKDVKALTIPDKGDWGAYLAVWGHATGIGCKKGLYYIMDPNYGLFEYKSKEDWLADIGIYVEARRKLKKMKPEDEIMLFPYQKK